ncbi:SGNH/GDSL hydrolase family protein [Opitutus sp. ER46]|uniref:SGNH/GDSL hydrolase family protein n=1 Tax=Opitutus sp. ER46 TaxID=2161864 RepID=UPI000D30FA7D|nr:SGNH/GDSL hydrolase family protein [Opitutus sp. ER46]PTX90962.1 SGNH/GDSL hydrolase family protein [Opitutus sp. ER46]
MMLARLLTLVVLLAPSAALRAADAWFHPREGLPHIAAARQAPAGSVLRVAYLGGSITAAPNGWRSLSADLLRQLLPSATIDEISAGVPGTGSDLGACRLQRDVLRHAPDLLFVEFAVNDAQVPPERIERTIEGIVRQTWRARPQTDICFVYTVAAASLPDIQAGRYQASARAMENVAAHYGIPSVHFGGEVAARLEQGRLVFKGPAPSGAPESIAVFSDDGVHPTAAGHRVYADVLAAVLPQLLQPSTAQPHRLPPRLHADNWEHAGLRPVTQARRDGAWAPVLSDDAGLRGVQKSLLPPTWRTEQPGAAVEFECTGTIVGVLGIAGPDSGNFKVTVDDRPAVITTFFDRYASPTFCRLREWFYPEALPSGTHRVRIELLATGPDKLGIKAAAHQPLSDPAPYRPNRLTLSGLLVVEE